MITENVLFSNENKLEDVNIIVGINGSGKSSYLNEIAKYHISKNKIVIAIANTIYDKFTIKGPNAKVLKNSKGKNIVRDSIKDVIKILESENFKAFYRLRNVFEYINFSPIIEFKINNLNPDFKERLIESHLFNNEEKDDLLYFLNRAYEHFLIENEDKFILDFYNNGEFDNLRNVFFLKILNYENKLRKLKILRNIEIVLIKNGERFELNSASSGELSIIASLIFISAHINENSIILIDEPENSLHPKWQIEYVNQILDLFYLFQPKIIIATHSPLIINGSEVNLPSTNIFKGNGFKNFIKQKNDLLNVEEIYEDYFEVTTPENRYVSETIIEEFNLLAEKRIKYYEFKEFVEKLIDNSYEVKQIEALKGILKLAEKFKQK